MNNIYAIVMAAGKGKRIGARIIPKVMFPVHGKPMIGYVAELLKKYQILKPIFIVGFKGQYIIDYLREKNNQYVWQKKRLGTGHAVNQTKKILKDKNGMAFILSGDMPFFSVNTLRKMQAEFETENAALALATADLGKEFAYGRIIRDKNGYVQSIVEEKNCTSKQLKIKEKNCSPYLAKLPWLFEALKKVKKDSLSKEYYLTDIVEIAIEEGKKVIAVKIDNPLEAVGINTLENLAYAEKISHKIKL